jgi:hypothetical protein
MWEGGEMWDNEGGTKGPPRAPSLPPSLPFPRHPRPPPVAPPLPAATRAALIREQPTHLPAPLWAPHGAAMLAELEATGLPPSLGRPTAWQRSKWQHVGRSETF